MKKIIIAIIVILLVVLGIYYFGGDREPVVVDNEQVENESVLGESNVREFTIEASHFEYDVKEIRVQKGDTVRINFVNEEGFHDLVIDEFEVATAQIQAGESETIEFVADEAGTFEYYCSVGEHRSMGMVGTLIVEEVEE